MDFEALIENITHFNTTSILVSLVYYLFFAFSLQTIARKTHTKHPWLAWIPLANLYLMVKISERPLWYLLVFAIPLVNVAIWILVWIAIARRRCEPGWYGVFMLFPVFQLLVIGYLAFVEELVCEVPQYE